LFQDLAFSWPPPLLLPPVTFLLVIIERTFTHNFIKHLYNRWLRTERNLDYQQSNRADDRRR
jgi:hypothetical protein